MKKAFLATIFLLLSAFAFAQELVIVVAPFEVRVGSGFSQDDVEAIEYLFLNELSKSKTIKVLDQSDAMFKETIKRMDFELSDWSNPKKVAEFGKALNANAVVLGRMMKLDNELIIAVRINDLTTEIKAANDMVVTSVSEVRGKLSAFTKEIVDRLPKPPPPPSYDNAKRNYLEFISGYVQFGDGFVGGGASFIFGGHISPLPFISFGLETRFGKFNNGFYGSASPMTGLVFPLGKKVKLYGDAILELGYFGGLNGLIGDWITPAFDAGILFWFDNIGFDIKYRGTWYEDNYIHSIGIGLLTHTETFFMPFKDIFSPIAWIVGSNGGNFFNGLTFFGYTYTTNAPLGFTLGVYGVYTSLNFALPDWGDYNKVGSSYSDTKYSTVYPPNYNSSSILDQRDEIIDWVIGYSITIIPRIFYLPVGIGIESVKEWRLQRLLDSDGKDQTYPWDPEWNPAPQWENTFIFEAGILLRPPMEFSPYILGTYRYLGTKEHSFSISVGVSGDFIFN